MTSGRVSLVDLLEDRVPASRGRGLTHCVRGPLRAAGYPEVSAEIEQAGPFYYAEDYHQQYLHTNPFGYDCHAGAGISCPVGLNIAASTAEARSVGSSQ